MVGGQQLLDANSRMGSTCVPSGLCGLEMCVRGTCVWRNLCSHSHLGGHWECGGSSSTSKKLWVPTCSTGRCPRQCGVRALLWEYNENLRGLSHLALGCCWEAACWIPDLIKNSFQS